MCVTKVSHTAPNEGIFDTKNSLRIAPINGSATTFDSGHEDRDGESAASASTSSGRVERSDPCVDYCHVILVD
jgi:hypothetical protein